MASGHGASPRFLRKLKDRAPVLDRLTISKTTEAVMVDLRGIPWDLFGDEVADTEWFEQFSVAILYLYVPTGRQSIEFFESLEEAYGDWEQHLQDAI